MISTEAASRLALAVFMYHVLGTAAALVIENWIKTNRYLKSLGFALCVGTLVSCSTPPIKVVDRPDIKAITAQNETTKKHIKTFTGHTKKVQERIEVSIEEGVKEQGNLQSVKKDLEELLKQ